DVDDVIGQRRIAPHAVLKPERRMREWVILLRCSEVEPDSRQPMQRLELDARDVLVIVPQQSAVPNGLIRGERGNQKDGTDEPRWPPTWAFGSHCHRLIAVRDASVLAVNASLSA